MGDTGESDLLAELIGASGSTDLAEVRTFKGSRTCKADGSTREITVEVWDRGPAETDLR